MATALFINRQDLLRNSIIDGNVDTDKYIQFIKLAQEIHIQNYMGTKMYNALSEAMPNIDDPENERWKSLLDNYIVPMVIWFSQVDYIPFSSYQIRNGGMFKHRSENAESVSKDEVDFLVEKARTNAEWYSRRFVDYMSFNQTTYPEYYSNVNNDIRPSYNATFNGWVL